MGGSAAQAKDLLENLLEDLGDDLQAKANPDLQDANGITALMSATNKGHDARVQELLQAKGSAPPAPPALITLERPPRRRRPTQSWAMPSPSPSTSTRGATRAGHRNAPPPRMLSRSWR